MYDVGIDVLLEISAKKAFRAKTKLPTLIFRGIQTAHHLYYYLTMLGTINVVYGGGVFAALTLTPASK